MSSATEQRRSGRPHLLGQVGRLLVVVTVVTLAVVGVGVAAWQIRGRTAGGSGSAAVGQAVETSYGSFTVTRESTSKSFRILRVRKASQYRRSRPDR